MRDAMEKGRISGGLSHSLKLRGELSSGAKLTWKEVRQMRAIKRERNTAAKLAFKYGVSPENIRYILNFKTWKE